MRKQERELRVPHGEVTHVLQIGVDATAARTAEAELARFKRLIDSSDDYMVLIDSDQDLLVMNRKVLDELGYTEDELIGKPAFLFVAEADRERVEAARESAHAFGVAIDAVHLLKKDGGLVPIHVSVAYDKETGVYACIGRDVSERQRMEDDLRCQHEKVLEVMREKNHFFRSVSHELRTPLTSIIGFTELLLEDTDDPLKPRQQAQLKRVIGNAHKLLGMVNDILDISKIEAGKMRVEWDMVKIDEILRQVVGNMAPLAAEKNLAIDVQVPGDLSDVTTDEQKLGQIMVNLISNAIKFTDHGGIDVSASRNGGTIAISVRDTGIGITEGELGEIFHEFHQVHRKGRGERGTGLGLAIARKLARLLGGNITVESKEGVGSTFTLTLPIRPKTPRSSRTT